MIRTAFLMTLLTMLLVFVGRLIGGQSGMLIALGLGLAWTLWLAEGLLRLRPDPTGDLPLTAPRWHADGLPALALTDTAALYGAVTFSRACQAAARLSAVVDFPLPPFCPQSVMIMDLR